MEVAIFEIGNFHESADITKVYATAELAIESIPVGFKKMMDFSGYWENQVDERWVTIKTYTVK